ncbi:DUF2231 domain-containing protein [Funiculus sociatus GB2-A5]|jgi:uncharacterized membrane protein|uniref:DUF2231 domain-containing protein n=1 Tax=Funiculus sociatus GB2-A5 TaxID=2933946 RepID=A0ABV0JLL9_9CYAN|nr:MULTISPECIES: DUF2231 domain-containing protein [unclassified Trichocoleus]MBD1903988.1 DUF2231 domain-containing protein [Trichocoleus sp. FACHB-832]MBD2062759.1 DUF2231 domain-containing protein [Trichocoleus sp. FACHB-6]
MTQTPNVPPLIESDESDYRDSGVTSTVAIAAHPLHPLIVTFPITLLTTPAAADLAYWWTKDMFWAQVSIWLIGLGLASGIIAAITGMMDFLKIERVRKRSAGWAHMVLNVAALTLTIVNLIFRWGNTSGAILPLGLTLSIIVAVLLGLSGWYGAELVYRHKVAVIGYGDPNR